MKQHYLLNDYLEHERQKTIKDRILYLSLAFRPITTILICIILLIVVTIPCVILMVNYSNGSAVYNVAFALLTGTAASAMVSIVIELANNYRHNYQRLLVLHEYLLTIAHYEDLVEWCLHGRKDEDCPGDFTAREMSVSELVLETGPIIESAYQNGKEYMSLEEMKQAIIVIEAASKIGELAESYASEHMMDATGVTLYQQLQEPVRSNLSSFASAVGISLVDENIMSVIADYILTNPTELDSLEQHDLSRYLDQFDSGMKGLQDFIKSEPGYHIELIPWDKRLEKDEKKFKKQFEESEKRTIQKLQKAVEEGRITQGEFEEYYRITEESGKADLSDFTYLCEKYGLDNDDAIDAEIEKAAERQTAERLKKMLRAFRIVAKADGINYDPDNLFRKDGAEKEGEGNG